MYIFFLACLKNVMCNIYNEKKYTAYAQTNFY